jgi:hypothetical protein
MQWVCNRMSYSPCRLAGRCQGMAATERAKWSVECISWLLPLGELRRSAGWRWGATKRPAGLPGLSPNSLGDCLQLTGEIIIVLVHFFGRHPSVKRRRARDVARNLLISANHTSFTNRASRKSEVLLLQQVTTGANAPILNRASGCHDSTYDAASHGFLVSCPLRRGRFREFGFL